MKWIAFYSQTGSEIVKLSERLGYTPDVVVTNNFNVEERYPGIEKSVIQSGKHDLLMDYFRNQTLFSPQDTLITLHGYLRIIPEDICEKYCILNGHPGLITMYPELKGKDPQVRAWEGKYAFVGSVVHHVTPGVDEGDVINSVAYINRCDSLDEMYGLLKQSSLDSWLNVFRSYR